ncbi:GNAT family N-acetyltransferase [Jeotgalibacillus soli]|uniref:N-acetyltransferase domain-containing protein n=1 Tax=Jeotgalibacillus soli TaxID=889306 RepID=A0A0C2S6H0_9BACL|nr:GNAT family N-acetyltransferase [Jeotgalibacillus soli]KIL49624.1 hypothetical protein KP78_10920 [Jeotgalibacillus soli]
MTEIRLLTVADFEKSLALSSYAFQYIPAEDMLDGMKEAFNQQDVWGIFDGEKLHSKLHLLHFHIKIAGADFKMGGIAGVATYPEYRRNKEAKSLIVHALKEMKKNGETISYLHPFSVDFYRRMGWEIVSGYKEIKIRSNDMHFMESVQGEISRHRIGDHLEQTNAVYDQFRFKRSGMLERTDYWWKKTYGGQEDSFATYKDPSGKATGYLTYEIENKRLTVNEFVALNQEARKGLWNFICQHDSMIDMVKIRLDEQEPLPFLMKQPKSEQTTTPYFMGRVVDVQAFLLQYPFQGDASGLTFKVQDELAPWNNGIFKILQNGSVEKLEDSFVSEEIISVGIQHFSSMMVGYIHPRTLHEIELLHANPEAVDQLEKRLPAGGTAFFDFF